MVWHKQFGLPKIRTENSKHGSTRNNRMWSMLPELYGGDPKRISRYNQYDDMDRDPEINAALNITADFCTQIEERNDRRILTFRFKTEPTEQEVVILKHALERWTELNDFSRRLWHIVRNTIQYGDQFFIRDPETYEWIWLDPRNVLGVAVDETNGKTPVAYMVKDLDPNLNARIAAKQDDETTPLGSDGLFARSSSYTTSNQSRFNLQQNQMLVSAEYVVHISLSVGMDTLFPFGMSVLDPVFKTFVQKNLLEEAILIYRIQRAPERRVFYIDVGDMRPKDAMVYLERIKNEIQQQAIPSRNSKGGVMSDGVWNTMSILDDYYFTQGMDGRGSKVEVLPGGDGIANIEDLKYFNNKLLRGLGVPANYISSGPEDQQSVFSDGKSGAGLQQELKFTRYCMRLQAIVAKSLDKEFKRFLDALGVDIDLSFFEVQFNPPQNFSQFAQIERDTAQMQVFQPVSDMKFISKRFAMKRFLNLSDEEIEENIRLWKEENASKVRKGVSNDEPDDLADSDSISSDAAALGLRDLDNGPSISAPASDGAPTDIETTNTTSQQQEADAFSTNSDESLI